LEWLDSLLRGVGSSRVGYRDIEGIEHHLELEADTLFEAVAHAVHRFRSSNWGGQMPGAGCEFSVQVQPQAPVTYSITLSKVEEFARFGTVKGPRDLLRKQRLRELLGIRNCDQ
jgi:hypothetical protein